MSVSDEMLEESVKVAQKLEEELEQAMPTMEADQGLVPVSDVLQQVSVEWSQEKTKGKKKKRKEEDDDAESQRNPSSDKIADAVFSMYEGQLRYSQPHGQFFCYNEKNGLWSPLTKIEMFGDIRHKLKDLVLTQFLPAGFSSNKINDMYTQLQSMLLS